MLSCLHLLQHGLRQIYKINGFRYLFVDVLAEFKLHTGCSENTISPKYFHRHRGSSSRWQDVLWNVKRTTHTEQGWASSAESMIQQITWSNTVTETPRPTHSAFRASLKLSVFSCTLPPALLLLLQLIFFLSSPSLPRSPWFLSSIFSNTQSFRPHSSARWTLLLAHTHTHISMHFHSASFKHLQALLRHAATWKIIHQQRVTCSDATVLLEAANLQIKLNHWTDGTAQPWPKFLTRTMCF